MADFKIESIEGLSSGLDAFFEREPAVITPFGQEVQKTAATKPGRMKVASLSDLNGFVRSSSDTLVHKSTKELWALRQNGEGYFVERLFNDSGTPLKG